MQTNKDPYKTLGISRDASQDDVRKAHRKLVREYHPDANPEDPRAEGRFKEVQQAYEVLSDEKKRREYDEGLRTSSRGRSPGRARSRESSRESSSRPRTRAGGRAGVDTTYTSSGQASHDRGPLFSLGYLLGIALVTLVIALLVLLVLGLN